MFDRVHFEKPVIDPANMERCRTDFDSRDYAIEVSGDFVTISRGTVSIAYPTSRIAYAIPLPRKQVAVVKRS